VITALIDADSLCYAVGFSSNDVDEALAVSRLEATVVELCMDLECDDYKGFLTGKGNFRNDIAVTAPYKGTRPQEKPVHLQALRDHLVNDWEFVVTEGIEADDAVGIAAYALDEDESIMVHIDKDLNQFRGHHYNYRKKEKYYVSEFAGWHSFYLQILTGDRVDNIEGLKGIGPAKGTKLLKDCTTVEELYDAVLKAYDGDTARVLENGQLLYLQRKEGDVWQPPQR
jgi:L-rhamnose isomerase